MNDELARAFHIVRGANNELPLSGSDTSQATHALSRLTGQEDLVPA
jgi:hypothetical protein